MVQVLVPGAEVTAYPATVLLPALSISMDFGICASVTTLGLLAIADWLRFSLLEM